MKNHQPTTDKNTRKLMNIADVLGLNEKEINFFFYIYGDGAVEKKIYR